MIESEMFVFMDTFRGLARVFPLRGEERELMQVGSAYFKAMRRFPLSAVQAGAEVWLAQGKRFPKPAEWLESIPKRPTVVEAQALSVADAEAYQRAERLRYEDRPCPCLLCQGAGVSEKPLRFVPEVDAAGRDATALLGDRIVTTGHWAHGEELARWYAARQAFWAAMFERFGCETPKAQRRLRTSFEQRIREIYREPPRTDASTSGPTKVTP